MFKKTPKHIVRLVFLLSFFLLSAYIAKIFLTDPSFYKYGHYRADVIPELVAGEPVYRGSAFCLECHKARMADWSSGAHVSVQCEVCHGTYRGCPENGKSMIPSDTIRLCSTCHEAMPARPERQPQVVLAEHPIPGEEIPQCQTCHDPHSPTTEELVARALGADAQPDLMTEPPAHLTEVIARCARCHGQQGQGRRKNPALAGMESAVFIDLMKKFKSGAIESKRMARYAEPLSDEEIEELAHFYESLPAGPSDNSDEQSPETPPE